MGVVKKIKLFLKWEISQFEINLFDVDQKEVWNNGLKIKIVFDSGS